MSAVFRFRVMAAAFRIHAPGKRRSGDEAALAGGTSIGFESSVCAGVPVIGAIRDGMVANRVESLHGILNGTTNYILTRMVEDKVPYAQTLIEAIP